MATQFTPLLDALRKLKSSGADGFEGLIRDLLEIVAARTLRLAKSGPQGGKDLLADPQALAPGVAVEAKRFGEKTDLPLDALKSKLRDAIASTIGLDVWAVALSREMKQPDWSELVQIGAEAGITLLCLDWRDEPGALPVLAALCAAGQDVAEKRLTGNFTAIFNAIKAHAQFQTVIDELQRKLTAPEVGYDLARQAAHDWLQDTVASLDRARQRLRSFADVRGPDAHLIHRPPLTQQLSNWYETEKRTPAVLLGDEGVGKTWVALDWCLTEAQAVDAPLVLASSARDLQGTDPLEILANLVRQFMPGVTLAQLTRRLERWAKSSACRVVLLVDGLNEAWDRPWAEIVRRFDTDLWRDRVALLLTCRGPVWRDDLLRLSGAAQNPIVEIEVPRFTDDELNSYLQTFGLDRSALSAGLLSLIRIPRFAKLAISLRAQLGDGEDITVARLVLEDWRSRLAQRGSELRISDERLLDLVADLGRDVLTDDKFSLSRAEIHSRLAEDSGEGIDHYRATIDELVSGVWLKPSNKQHKYVVDKHLLPYAIGLDLSRVLQPLSDRQAIEQAIAEYLDSLRGADFGVAILRAATTISFARAAAAPLALATLLKTWVAAQNFTNIDFDEMWRLIVLQPTLVLDLAEAHWRQQPVTPREGELFAKGLANASKWPVVQDLLVARFPRWIGAFGLDPIHWYHYHIPRSEERVGGTLPRLAAWHTIEPSYHRNVSSHFRQDEDEYLPEAALAIMSYLPRAPFVETIVTWAVTRAIMDHDLGVEQFHWLLRINANDHAATESALIDEIQRLSALQNPVATEAANILAAALATPAAMTFYHEEPQNSDQRTCDWPALNEEQSIVWPHSGKTGGNPLKPDIWAHRLATFATNPQAKISAADEVKFQSLINEPGQLDWQYGNIVLAVARWTPKALAHMARQEARTLPLSDPRQTTEIVRNLTEASIVFGTKERQQLRALASRELASFTTETDNQSRWNYHSLFTLSLIGESAAQQIEALKTLLPTFLFSTDLGRLLAEPSPDEISALLDTLRDCSDEAALGSWLGYLKCVKLPALPANKGILSSLCEHPSEHVRAAAMEVILHAEDQTLGTKFAEGSWRHVVGQSREEAIRGTLLLAQFGKHLSLNSLRGRMLPQALPYLIQERGSRSDEIRALFDYLIEQLDEEISKERGTRHGYTHFSAKETWRKTIMLDSTLVFSKFREAVRAGMVVGFFDFLPLSEILGVLMELDPANGAEIWRSSKKAHRNFNLTAGDFEWLPFEVAQAQPVGELWSSIFDDATNDQRLADVVFRCLRGGGEAWLLEKIRRDLGAPGADQIARGLALAGFLDDTPAARTLWTQDVDPMPLRGWLAQIRIQARSSYDRNAFARHWLEQFFATTDREQAFAYLTLFHACADDRHVLWAGPMLRGAESGSSADWVHAMNLNRNKRQNGVTKLKDEFKKNLYFTKTSHDVAPWF